MLKLINKFSKKVRNKLRSYIFRGSKSLISFLKKFDNPWSDPNELEKATNFTERHREIISDPINQLIAKDPKAGYIDGNNVILHNGNKVAFEGSLAYYKEFSEILILNRGVHEPLEEYCFQQLMATLSGKPLMIELGAYWSHYSMWMLKNFPDAECIMVEPDKKFLACGRHNFFLNNCQGEFINEFVSKDGFILDEFVNERNIRSVDLLHSDIQGYELEMLEGAETFLEKHGVNYLFVSTHSTKIHSAVEKTLSGYGYCIEVSSDFDFHTTSSDGFILASAPNCKKVFNEFQPLGRLDILNSSPLKIADYLNKYK